MSQPRQCYEIGCPLAGKSVGFALPSGDFSKVKIVGLLETPATNEISWPVRDLPDGEKEIERRRLRYPDLEPKHIEVGAAVVGKAGATLFSWMLSPFGIHRNDIGLVNTLHCYPGKKPDGTIAYPTGDVRKRAEACCSTLWWGGLREWEPTVAIVCLHPSAISREPSPLPVTLKVIEKAKHFSLQGEKVLILMGGKAAKAWLGHADNPTIWSSHYEIEGEYARMVREERRVFGMGVKVGVKEKKVKKLTVKGALGKLLSVAQKYEFNGANGPDYGYQITWTLTKEEFEEMSALTVSKVKKEKV